MKVLVTGGCGFLGSHVCELYRGMGEEVVSLDNLTKHELVRTGYDVEGARLHNWNVLKEMGVQLVKGDIRNKEEVFEAARDCDYIVHTAAQPAMTISIEQPELDLYSNVVGTFNVLEAARAYDIPVVSCSSIHVYGNQINETIQEGEERFIREPPAIDESYPVMQGKLTPLHVSKRAGELYVQTYIDTYGLDAATFRLTGMYGPRQFGGEDHGWVANFVIRTVLGLPMKVFGTDKQMRDILYVSDAAAAFDAFYRHPVPGLYNIGGGERNIISIRECLRLIREFAGREQHISYEPKRHGDLWYFVCDITRAREHLKWEPRVSNEEGIRRLVKWVQDNVSLFKG
ncbi:NAD-dependent epimerase/dehydratase family protein [Methermicoccus shengliensis]|uniref:NAD-dependent epimerase/dehydratase family protein n=1 Tax=Methermicoccus shengliensis TaxID=660064 RepID=UPI0005B2CEEF|nr:NAD-dependent epimerase/dehydratase family protein [Methermicoccus shengliensis]